VGLIDLLRIYIWYNISWKWHSTLLPLVQHHWLQNTGFHFHNSYNQPLQAKINYIMNQIKIQMNNKIKTEILLSIIKLKNFDSFVEFYLTWIYNVKNKPKYVCFLDKSSLNILDTNNHLYIRNLKYAHLTYFSTTQYLFSILYLLTQIQMNIVYRKNGFKREISRFLMYKYK
jgi:hypothetical protein